MKNRFAQILMLAVLTIGFASFANAQTGPTHRVTIPFNFIVGEKSFSAGEYTVNFGVSSALREGLFLRSADGKQSAIVNQVISKNAVTNSGEPNLVFYVADQHYYLAEINTQQKSVELRSSHIKKMPKNRKYELALAR